MAGYLLRDSGYSLTPWLNFMLNPIQSVKKISVPKVFANPEHLHINIKGKNFLRLAKQRETAINQGVLLTMEDDEYVPAFITHNDKTVKVKIRLKGDWIDHLQGDKWSFRIKIQEDETVFGMKRFSIQHPATRNYLHEWVFHQLLKKEDILSLRYDFINVTLNGKNLGIYALEEHFDKRLLEHNQRREGPIIKFNENMLWQDRMEAKAISESGRKRFWSGFLQSYYSSEIHFYQSKGVSSDSSLKNQFNYAHSLLELFRTGKLPAHKVFDINKLSKYFVLSDIAGAQHGSGNWENLRFYYNPVTSLLEPIGFDGDAGQVSKPIIESEKAGFHSAVFEDTLFVRGYMTNLEKFSRSDYLNTFFTEISETYQNKLNIILSEWPDYAFNQGIYYNHQKYIDKMLSPPRALHAYINAIENNYIELDIGNIQAMPLNVISISYNDLIFLKPAKREIIRSRKSLDLPIDFQKIKFALPPRLAWDDIDLNNLKLNYEFYATNRKMQTIIYPWKYLDETFINDNFIRKESNIHDFTFILINEEQKTIHMKSGTWNLTQNLIIPNGYKVMAHSGLRLNLSNSAKILSYSPIYFIGTEEAPIFIYSSDSTGQGLVVMSANQKSVLEYVNFNNLSNATQKGWELTGAVNFYESDCRISHSTFANNRSEDGLNIIRSKFEIDHCLFQNVQSDAFDGDFTAGTISNTRFINAGNDGIDVSGSQIEIRNIFISKAGDKGISVGENSILTGGNVHITDSELGITSKDLSEINLSHVKILATRVGFTVFQKKSEFGPALISVNHLEMSNLTVPYLIEKNSKLSIDNQMIEPNAENIEGVLYGVQYGKKSK